MQKQFIFTETEAKAYDAMRAAFEKIDCDNFSDNYFCDAYDDCKDCPFEKAQKTLRAVNAELEKDYA